MSYTVKFMKSEEFDQLPYNRITTSLGVADRNKNVAYVRDTANPMDVFTAFHELEHLKGDDLDEYESPGEDGVYYKDTGTWMQTLAPIAAFIPGIGPIASAGMAAGGTAMNARSQAKAQKSAMGQQMGQGQQAMDNFNPSMSMSQGAPATSMSGGGGGDMGGALGAGTIDKVRGLLQQRQSGFYSGRDAGAF